MDENKQIICDRLAEALKATYAFNHLHSMVYDKEEQLVYVWLKNDDEPSYTVNVNWDSGIAMISDILKALGLFNL